MFSQPARRLGHWAFLTAINKPCQPLAFGAAGKLNYLISNRSISSHLSSPSSLSKTLSTPSINYTSRRSRGDSATNAAAAHGENSGMVDHSHEKADRLWKAERYLSLALLGVIPAAWVIPHPFMDYAVAASLVVHVHWGIEAIVVDYIRPSIFGPVIPKIAIGVVYVLSVLAAGGLFIFNWTDVGITQAFKMLADL